MLYPPPLYSTMLLGCCFSCSLPAPPLLVCLAGVWCADAWG